ncbi:MAG: adenylosuccinate synthase [Patescibacteria group bacterium]
MIHVVTGAQWGDEGKGKIVDLFSQKAHVIVRFHGGNNAGHTVINSFGSFPLHLVPCGVFTKKGISCITSGVVLDLDVLVAEITMLEKVLPNLRKKLIISPRCHVILPYHKLLDRLYEEAKGKSKTGTTGRGIGPVYADKVSYQGIRLNDFQDAHRLKEKLTIALSIKNKIIQAFGESVLDVDTIVKEQMALYKKIHDIVREPMSLLFDAYKKKKTILYEGAQGMFLDNDWGTYPFVTASSTVAGSITASSGIPAQYINRVTGVTKAYTTRVGSGPFPTELSDAVGEKLRAVGKEYGATTGRPRRCGWFDAELVRFASKVNGFTDLAITKIDVLDSFETIKICTGYTFKGKHVSYEELDAYSLAEVQGVYKEMKGWKKPLGDIKKYALLPKEAKAYLLELEKQTGAKIKTVSVGPNRNQTLYR